MEWRGVNLGGWLLMEGYILGGRNVPEHRFKKDFLRRYGKKELGQFEKKFRDNFIREKDFYNIANLGAKCVRLPFNYRLLEERPVVWDEEGFKYRIRAVRWASQFGLKVILDLHAAAGAQNADWHSDSSGHPHLWKSSFMQKRTYWLWENIVERLKDEDAVLGYDILNEPVVARSGEKVVERFYRSVIKRIRAIDRKRLIFLEGNKWAQEIDFLAGLLDSRIVVSIHFYQPLNFVFNFHPRLSYPGKIDGKRWNKSMVEKFLSVYYKFKLKYNTEIFVGEFGINWRRGVAGEGKYLADVLDVFDQFGFGYTYWTYKGVSLGVFPSGIYEYYPNSIFVRRQGPVYGWENYLDLWEKKKHEIVNFWRTEVFDMNTHIAEILKSGFRRGRKLQRRRR